MKLISTTKTPPATSTKTDGVVPLSQVGSPKTSPLQRLQTGLADRNWGTASEPGIVPRSVSLFFGKIGAGNSTFVLDSFYDDGVGRADADLIRHANLSYGTPFILGRNVGGTEEAVLTDAEARMDTVLEFTTADILTSRGGKDIAPPESCGQEPFRILRTTKNRFGDVSEQYFTMTPTGLVPFFVDESAPRA